VNVSTPSILRDVALSSIPAVASNGPRVDCPLAIIESASLRRCPLLRTVLFSAKGLLTRQPAAAADRRRRSFLRCDRRNAAPPEDSFPSPPRPRRRRLGDKRVSGATRRNRRRDARGGRSRSRGDRRRKRRARRSSRRGSAVEFDAFLAWRPAAQSAQSVRQAARRRDSTSSPLLNHTIRLDEYCPPVHRLLVRVGYDS
jgi:hypothetical protein